MYLFPKRVITVYYNMCVYLKSCINKQANKITLRDVEEKLVLSHECQKLGFSQKKVSRVWKTVTWRRIKVRGGY